MVSAIQYFATDADHELLLDHLGEPDAVSLHPWPVVATPIVTLSRTGAMASDAVMIVNRGLGAPVVIRADNDAMAGPTRSALFNRLNWERLAPTATEGIVDSNTSPVLFWEPATRAADTLTAGSIGSQADSMRAVSTDFERWVSRTTAWVRRNGTRVWGLSAAHRRADLDVQLATVSAVYALPDALRLLEAGGSGR